MDCRDAGTDSPSPTSSRERENPEEEFLVQDLDSYFDEINNRLGVSRMVSDSVIKGMVSAVVAEAAEKIAAKEAEIESFKRMLKGQVVVYTDEAVLDASVESEHRRQLHRFISEVDEHLRTLEEDVHNDNVVEVLHTRIESIKTLLASGFQQISGVFGAFERLMSDHRAEHRLRDDISSTLMQNTVKDLQDGFEKRLQERNVCVDISKLTALRDELGSISKSLLNQDPAWLQSYDGSGLGEVSTIGRRNSLSGSFTDRRSIDRQASIAEGDSDLIQENPGYLKDSAAEVSEFLHVKHMSSEELISFFRAEILKMKRQHEIVLHEKTEEEFKLKRALLKFKEKGSFSLRRDGPPDAVRTEVLQLVSKADEMLLELDKFIKLVVTHRDSDETNKPNDHITSPTHENGNVADAAGQRIGDKREEFMAEDDSKEASECVNSDNSEHGMDDLKIYIEIVQEMYAAIYGSVISDAVIFSDSVLQEHFLEKTHLQDMIIASERSSMLLREENHKLQQAVRVLTGSMEEKEQTIIDIGLELTEQKEVLERVNDEMSSLREQCRKQEVMLSESNEETASLKCRLDEATKQIERANDEVSSLGEQCSKQEAMLSQSKEESNSLKFRLDEAVKQIEDHEKIVDELTQDLKCLSNTLDEFKLQNVKLQSSAEEKNKKIVQLMTKETGREKELGCICDSLSKFMQELQDLEIRLMQKMEIINSRVKSMNCEIRPLAHHVALLRKNSLRYKQMLDVRTSNLQKAEAEVDLLGDEVDTLMRLLENIYVALDHYSPVLQHYPGVMETLKLVQRELKVGHN